MRGNEPGNEASNVSILRSLDICLLHFPCTPRILDKENKESNRSVKTSKGLAHGQKLLNTKDQILWLSNVHIPY